MLIHTGNTTTTNNTSSINNNTHTTTTRAIGMIFGAVAGAVLYNKKTWGWGFSIADILMLNGAFPLVVIVPLTVPLVELAYATSSITSSHTSSIRGQMSSLWRLLQLKAVWRPMIFIYIYNVMQIPNPSWYHHHHHHHYHYHHHHHHHHQGITF